jgi:hypothetical protein
MLPGEEIVDDLAERYYLDLAAAFVRGRLGLPADLAPVATFRAGQEAGLRLHKFKRTAELPRVQKVLGILRGLAPADLLDIGSGRGVFLWPLLAAFPGAVGAGGLARLRAARMDVEALALPAASVDVATVLEVLEHVARPDRAAAELMRVARRAVVASVPAKPDDNPEHIRLFTRPSLEALWRDAGARSVSIDYVPGHMIAVARV